MVSKHVVHQSAHGVVDPDHRLCLVRKRGPEVQYLKNCHGFCVLL